MSASVVKGFDDGFNTDQEIGPLCDAIPDLDETLVEDGNACVWKNQRLRLRHQHQQKMMMAQNTLTLIQL